MAYFGYRVQKPTQQEPLTFQRGSNHFKIGLVQISRLAATVMVQLVEVVRKSSVLAFFPEPERNCCGSHHINKAVKWRSREVSAILDDLN